MSESTRVRDPIYDLLATGSGRSGKNGVIGATDWPRRERLPQQRKEQETPDQTSMADAMRTAERGAGNVGILFIAVFDLVKAVLFLVAAVGVFHLVNRNTHVQLTGLLHLFRLDGDHAFARDLLLKANVITYPDKRILSGVLLLYTGMYAIEGIGLLLRKRWAEYFAVAMTVIPLPFEVHSLFHHATHLPSSNLLATDPSLPVLLHSQVSVLKFAVLIINVGIVWYLVYHLRHAATRGVREDPGAYC